MSAQTHLARQITNTVEGIDKDLEQIIADATALRAALREGTRMPGMFTALGQTPAKIERAHAVIDTLLTVARVAGLDDDAIAKAYTDGTVAWHERTEAGA